MSNFSNRNTPPPYSVALSSYKQVILAFVFSSFWLILAHGYRWVHVTSASHDSLMLVQSDTLWQISLGRFLQPLYIAVRGSVVSPWTCGLLGSLFIAVSVVIIIKILDVKHIVSIAALSGILCTNATITLTNATYINWFDVFALALLLAVCAILICKCWRFGFLASGVLLAASMGLYQAYIQVFLALAIVLFISQLARGARIREIAFMGLKLLIAVALGGAIYLLSMHCALNVSGVAAANTYNGVASVGDFSNHSLRALLVEAYRMPILYFWRPETHAIRLTGWINLLISVSVILLVVWNCLKHDNPKARIVLSVLLCLSLPLAMNCMYVISKGMVHGLMIYSYFMIYALAITVFEISFNAFNLVVPTPGLVASSEKKVESVVEEKHRVIRYAPLMMSFILGVVLVASNVIYAGQVYVLKDLESEATLSAMTRIVDRFEQMDGYEPGKTQVAIIGTLENSAITAYRADYLPDYMKTQSSVDASLPRGTGLQADYSVTYPATYKQYMDGILGYSVNMVNEGNARSIAALPEVKKPCLLFQRLVVVPGLTE